jgi:hypothetical protein
MRRNVLVMVTFLIAASTSAKFSAAADKPAETIEIHVAEIGSKVTLIGYLGQPLGKMMTVKGQWKYPGLTVKDREPILTITDVNEKQLAKPVEFYAAQVNATGRDGKKIEPKDGDIWILRGYETGSVDIRPDAELSQSPVWARPFTSELMGTVQPK